MSQQNYFQKVPMIAWICGTILLLDLVTASVILTVTGKPSDDLVKILQFLMNGIQILALGGVGAIAHRGAGSADTAATKLNGELDERIQRNVRAVMDERVNPTQEGISGDDADKQQ